MPRLGDVFAPQQPERPGFGDQIPAPRSVPAMHFPILQGPDITHLLDIVQEAGNGTLPTSLGLTMAQTVDPQDLHKAATLAARALDFSPTFLLQPVRQGFGSLGDYKDPVSGQEITLDTARRLLNPFAVPVMESILKRITKGQPDRNRAFLVGDIPKLRHIAGRDALDPTRVAATLDALGEANGHMLWSEALGAAIQIARTDTDLQLLRANLHWTSRTPGVTPAQAIGIAHIAAAAGTKFNSLADVVTFAVPSAPIQQAAELQQGVQDLEKMKRENPDQFYGTGLDTLLSIQQQRLDPHAAVLGDRPSVEQAAFLLSPQAKETTSDYLRAARMISKRYTMESQDFSQTMLGKAVNAVFSGLGAAQRTLESGASFVLYPFLHPGAATTNFSGAIRNDLAAMRQVQEGKFTLGDELVKSLHLPEWTGPIAELFIAYYTDPVILGGKAIAFSRERNLLMDAKYASENFDQRMNRVNAFLTKPNKYLRVEGSGPVTVPEYLVREAMRSNSAERFFVSGLDRFRTRWAAEGVDRTTASQIFDYVRSVRGRSSVAEMTQGVKEVLATAFGGKTDGLAEFITRERAAIDRQAQQRMADALVERYHGGAGTAYTVDVQRETDNLVRQKGDEIAGAILDDWEMALMTGPRVMHEIPQLRATSDLMRMLRNSGITDNGPGRSMSATINRVPRSVADLEGISGQSPEEWVRYYLRRARTHTPQELAEYRLNMSRVANPLHPNREAMFRGLVQKVQDEVVMRKALAAGWGRDDAETFIKEARARADETNRLLEQSRLYGVVSEPTGVPGVTRSLRAEEPLGPTQLLNQLAVVDPVEVERILRGNFLSLQRLRNRVLRVFGQPTIPVTHASVSEALGLDRFERGWRRLVVTRPAYVVRVPLLDENLRYAATLGWMSHFESTKTGARILTPFDRLFGTGREAEVLIDKQGEVGPVTVKLPRPGLVDDISGASQTTKGRAILESFEQETKRISRSLKETGGFKAVGRDAPHFYSSWAHDLNRQFGQDPVLSRILSDLAENVPAEQSVDRLVHYLSEDKAGQRFASRMGMASDSMRSAVEFRVSLIRHYAADDPAVASAALSGNVNPDILRAIPQDRQPLEVHGPELELTSNKTGVFSTVTDKISRAILEFPTNRLNRQPYAKAWFTNAKKAMLEEARARGQTLTPELTARIDAEAADFARQQVRRIMFDFRDQGRLGEMLHFVAPFFQPWLEAYTVWGRIIGQNPATVGYAFETIRQALDSGMVKRDPDTGQLVVPMGWWMGAAPLLHAMYGGNWQLSAPIQSFNLFFSQSLPVPTGGLAGDVPIPIPGFSPWFQAVVQKTLESDVIPMPESTRLRLMSWAFQYGPSNLFSVLPRWLYYAGMAISKGKLGAFTGDTFDSTANDFLRLQQSLGVHSRTDEPPPGTSDSNWKLMSDGERHTAWNKWLADSAKSHAASFLGLRGLFSLFFPAAPKIDFPDQQYQDELRRLEAKMGYEPGREEFMKRHPDLNLQTIPNTMWNRDIGGAVPIPATKAVAELMNLPGFKEFAQRHPQFIAGIIPKELRDGKFDLGTYYSQIAEGLRTVLTPEEVLADSDTQAGWDSYFAHRDLHDHALDGLVDANGKPMGQGSPPYDQEMAKWREWVADNSRVHPEWAKSYNSFETRSVDPKSVAWARFLVQDPIYSKFDSGKWLKGYLDGADALWADMKAANVRTLNSKAATELGFTGRYKELVNGLNKEFPDGKWQYQAFFGDQFSSPVTKGDQQLLGLGPKQSAEVTHQWAKWEALNDAPAQADPGPDKEQAFLKIREMADEAFSSGRKNWLMLWWNGKDTLEKRDYELRLMGRPYVFLSRFDRQVVLGETTSNGAEQKWLQLAQDQLQITQFRSDHPELPAAPLYTALDAQVKAWTAEDPVFGSQVANANQWGYQVEKMLPLIDSTSDAQPMWQSFLTALRNTQAAVESPVGIDSNGQPIYLHGSDVDIDPNKRALWIKLKQALEGYRDSLFQQSPQFQREWTQLEDINGFDSLIDQVMPDTFFPLGGEPTPGVPSAG